MAGNYSLVACSCGKIWLGTKESYDSVQESLKLWEKMNRMGPPFKQDTFDAIDSLKDRLTHEEND
jgi:hypothetical protein